jgi:hypothetical protein
MKSSPIKTVALWLICAALLLTAGCSKITKENYDKLKVGQNYSEVVKILGKADECSGALGIKDCRWGDDSKHISVKFAGNKAVLFSAKGI